MFENGRADRVPANCEAFSQSDGRSWLPPPPGAAGASRLPIGASPWTVPRGRVLTADMTPPPKTSGMGSAYWGEAAVPAKRVARLILPSRPREFRPSLSQIRT